MLARWLGDVFADRVARGTWILLFLLVGLVGTLFMHRAQVLTGFDLVPGRMGDTRLLIFLFDHWSKVFAGAVPWTSPIMMYPTADTLGFSDMAFGQGVAHAALRAVGLDLFDATIALIMGLSALAYLMAGLFLRQVFATSLVATCAGAWFFAFSSIKAMNMGPYQLHIYGLIPVVLLAVGLLMGPATDVRAMSRWRAFALTAAGMLCLALMFNSGWYLAWYTGFFLLLLAGVALSHRLGREWLWALLGRHGLGLLAAGAVFIAAMVPFLSLYLPARSFDKGHLPSVPTWDFLINMGPANFLWGWAHDWLPALPEESRMGVGYAMLILWALAVPWALVKVAWTGPATARAEWRLAVMVLATSAFTLLAIRWPGGFSAWDGVVGVVPGADAVRGLQRYMMMLTAPLAALLAMAVDRLLRVGGGTRARFLSGGAAMLLALAVMSEQVSGSFGFSADGQRRYFAALKAQLAPSCQLFSVRDPEQPFGEPGINEIPNLNRKYQADALLLAALTGLPTVNGFSGLYPRDYHLYKLYDPRYPDHLAAWLARHNIAPTPCVVRFPPFDLAEVRPR